MVDRIREFLGLYRLSREFGDSRRFSLKLAVAHMRLHRQMRKYEEVRMPTLELLKDRLANETFCVLTLERIKDLIEELENES